MTGEILNSILTKLNRQLSSKERNIMLFLDNAGCHPGELVGKYSNIIKVCFLPANTTSKLQPLDLGIIKNFKAHYRCCDHCHQSTVKPSQSLGMLPAEPKATPQPKADFRKSNSTLPPE